MKYPNCLIICVQKSGTTSLHSLLQAHPSISVSNPKEIHYFDKQSNYIKGGRWYCNHFNELSEIRLESTPFYFNSADSLSRMQSDLGADLKLIIILRSPIERAYSHYWHEVKFGWERKSFMDALEKEASRIKKGGEYYRHYSYLDRGRYHKYISQLTQYFDLENCLICDFDRLAIDQYKLLEEVCDFLGVERYQNLPKLSKEQQNTKLIPRIPALNGVCQLFDQLFGHPNILSQQVYKINLKEGDVPRVGDMERQFILDRLSSEIFKLKDEFNIHYPWMNEYL